MRKQEELQKDGNLKLAKEEYNFFKGGDIPFENYIEETREVKLIKNNIKFNLLNLLVHEIIKEVKEKKIKQKFNKNF